MSTFINTRDEIGDQNTVDGLVSHTLTELKEDGVSQVANRAFNYNDALRFVELPNVSRIGNGSFYSCVNLETVILGGEGSSNSLSIDTQAFDGCQKLKHLVINRPTVADISTQVDTFRRTRIRAGEGAIYVPSNLINYYRQHVIIGNYTIVPLERYPLSTFESISDSWSDILSNANYATDYTVKDTKIMELTDGTKIQMALAAINTDAKADNSGNAKMTWICHGIPFTHCMNSTSTASGGWAESEMRSWLISDVLSKIPTEIKSHIVSVNKHYRLTSPNDETLVSNDEIWIPSCRELGYTNVSYLESEGVEYSVAFTTDNASHIKCDTSGQAGYWWLRSGRSDTSFAFVQSNGSLNGTGASATYGVVFGFCTD